MKFVWQWWLHPTVSLNKKSNSPMIYVFEMKAVLFIWYIFWPAWPVNKLAVKPRAINAFYPLYTLYKTLLHSFITATLQRIQLDTSHTLHTQTVVVVVYQFKGGTYIFMNLTEGNLFIYGFTTDSQSFASLFQIYCVLIVDADKCYVFKLVVMCKLLVRCNVTAPLAVVIWFSPNHSSDSLISQSASQWARVCVYMSSTTTSNLKTNVHSGF